MSDAKAEEGEVKPKRKINLMAVAMGLQVLGLLVATGLIVKSAFFTKGPALTDAKLTERAIASIQDDVSKVQMLDLKEFRVNLPANHILKTNIQLEVSDPKTVDFLNTRMAAVKSGILDVLGAQNLKKTSSFQGKLYLKEAIREAINRELNSAKADMGVVRDVYFVEFMLK